MPNLLNRFKHEEFELNSAFQIGNQKETRSKRGAEEEQKSRSNFAPLCEIFACTFDFFCHFYSIFTPGTMNDKQMQFFKRKNFRVKFLKLNEDPIREMTIGHSPQREEMNPRTSQSP